FSSRIMFIQKKSDDFIYNREVLGHKFDKSFFNSLDCEQFYINSRFGYKLSCTFFKPYENKNKFIILSHGVTVNCLNSYKYAELFLKRGFNVLLYEHRRHGKSGGTTTSYGYYEKFDLKSVVDWVYGKFGDDIILGIHGESMGAATTILYAGELDDRCNFYICDSAFIDLEIQLKYQLKKIYNLPVFPFFHLSKLFVFLRDKYWLSSVSPISAIKNINNPVLLIHCCNDDYTLSFHSKNLYEKKRDNKVLYIAEYGKHACALNENRSSYEAAIDDFLKSNSIS
ncbi:MAG: alpha/beta hydrolase, partial [Bacillales bacterium]|nr:alpha/beta hydrolase [Bacillales bacterium]